MYCILLLKHNKIMGDACIQTRSTDTVFFFLFFLADLSYVGFVLVGDDLDIQR